MQPIRRTLETHLHVAAIGVIGLIGGAAGPAAEPSGSPQDVEFRSAADDSAQRECPVAAGAVRSGEGSPSVGRPSRARLGPLAVRAAGPGRVPGGGGRLETRDDLPLAGLPRARFVDGAGRRGGPGSDPRQVRERRRIGKVVLGGGSMGGTSARSSPPCIPN